MNQIFESNKIIKIVFENLIDLLIENILCKEV